MADYDFSMPFPPSINGYWRTFRNRQVISKRGREYRKASISHLESIGLSGENVEGALSVHMVINPPTLRKYDIDNFCKAPFDALSHAGFWLDDDQIFKLSIEKGEKVKGGRIDLKINKLAQ